MSNTRGSQTSLNEDQKKRGSRTKFFVHVAGKTDGAHQKLVDRIKQSGHVEVLDPDSCDYILSFCPVVSRVGTDIDEALQELPADKDTVLVVMHYKQDHSAVIADSSRLVNKPNVFTVDTLFYEGKLLKCDRNKQTRKKIQRHLGIVQESSSPPGNGSRTKFFVHVAGKTDGAHQKLVDRIKQSGHVQVLDPDSCDCILSFCPVVSRVGTDIDEALRELPADKDTVLVVMHYKQDHSAVIADSRRLVNKPNVFTVDCLFYEGKLLKCDRNKQTRKKIQRHLGIVQESSSPPGNVLQRPWRDLDWGQRQADLDYVKDFSPQDEAQQIRVLLHGPAGAGKSSFINSVHSVLHGRVYRQALEDNTGGSSFTKKYKDYKIPKGTSGDFYPFVFTDIMGLEAVAGGGVHVDDIKLALKGHVKDGYKFNPETRISEKDPSYNRHPTANDKIHVLVCVIPADAVSRMNDETLKKIKDIREEATRLNIVQMIMITKIDKVCPETRKNLRDVYRSKILKEMMEQISADVGISMNCIFPVKNYHEEIQLNDDADSLILSALRNIIEPGNDTQSESSKL